MSKCQDDHEDRSYVGRDEIRSINKKLTYLFNQGESLMATVQELKDAVAVEKAEVQAKLAELATEVQALKDVIAAGGNVTEAQLTEVLDAIRDIFTPTPTP